MKPQLEPETDQTVHNGAMKAAQRVLLMESESLSALRRSLNGDFIEAIDRLSAVTGRIIVSGMGKSGHIARKIAATLASTGSTAYFVHPS